MCGKPDFVWCIDGTIVAAALDPMRFGAKCRTLVDPIVEEKVIQLSAELLGICSVKGKRTSVLIPEGTSVQVASRVLDDNRMVEVLWEGCTVAVFAEDLFQSGQ